MTDFDDKVAVAKQAVEQVGQGFDEPDDDWMPVLLAFSGEALTVVGMATPKDLWPRLAQSIVRKENATFLAAVLSSWMLDSQRTPHQEIQRHMDAGGSVSSHPDRIEVLILDCSDGRRHETWRARIIRNEDAPPRLDTWVRLPGEGMAEGRMASITVGAFPPIGHD